MIQTFHLISFQHRTITLRSWCT